MSKDNKTLKEKFINGSPWYALFFIIFGVSLTARILWKFTDYSNGGDIQFQPSHPDSPPTFQDLATVLSGTVGLAFTLSGIIALLYTIYQTKQEMKENRDIFSQQLIDNTFFNLLQNHKNTVLQSEEERKAFKEQIELVEEYFKLYVPNAKHRVFDSFDRTHDIPSEIYTMKGVNLLRAVGRSIRHLIEFVEKKIGETEKDFYHQTIYNTLSDSERYLVGLMIEGNIIKNASIDLRGNYSEYFIKHSVIAHLQIEGLLPPVSLATKLSHHTHFRSMDDNEANENLISHATTLTPYSKDDEVKFLGIEYHFYYEKDGNKIKGNDYFEITGKERRISLLPAFKKHFYKIFLEIRTGIIDVQTIFILEYKGIKYAVHAGLTIRLIMQYIGRDGVSEFREELNKFLDVQKIDKCFYLVIKTK